MKNKVLKDYDKELTMNLLVNIGILLYLYQFNNLELIIQTKFILPSFISLFSPLLVINLIPDSWKLLCVGYLKLLDKSKVYKFIKYFASDKYMIFLKNYLFQPGYTIFKRLSNNKIRNNLIKKDVLLEKYGEFPDNNIAQNDLWYAIYRNHEYDPRVYQIHRNFLLMRDIVCVNIILMIVINVFYFHITLNLPCMWLLFMIIEISVQIFMCRKYCNKYVERVLVEETFHIEREKFNL